MLIVLSAKPGRPSKNSIGVCLCAAGTTFLKGVADRGPYPYDAHSHHIAPLETTHGRNSGASEPISCLRLNFHYFGTCYSTVFSLQARQPLLTYCYPRLASKFGIDLWLWRTVIPNYRSLDFTFDRSLQLNRDYLVPSPV